MLIIQMLVVDCSHSEGRILLLNLLRDLGVPGECQIWSLPVPSFSSALLPLLGSIWLLLERDFISPSWLCRALISLWLLPPNALQMKLSSIYSSWIKVALCQEEVEPHSVWPFRLIGQPSLCLEPHGSSWKQLLVFTGGLFVSAGQVRKKNPSNFHFFISTSCFCLETHVQFMQIHSRVGKGFCWEGRELAWSWIWFVCGRDPAMRGLCLWLLILGSQFHGSLEFYYLNLLFFLLPETHGYDH